jgi:predicted MFS family arabinose efflux permease
MIGWGSTFYVPSTLVRPLVRDLGLSNEMVFGGVTIMLLVSGLVAPTVGRYLDREGAAVVMACGSLVAAVALTVMAMSADWIGYAGAWVMIGVAMPMMLHTAGFVAMAQIAGVAARRPMSVLTLFTGLSATVAWPLTAWLEAELGWRTTLLMFAASHIAICLPLHLWALPRARADQQADAEPAANDAQGASADYERRAVLMTVVAFAGIGFVNWGLPLHLPEVLQAYGLPLASALWVAALTGPFQVSARLADIGWGNRFPARRVAVAAIALMPVALLVLYSGSGTLTAAILFALLWGVSNGLMTVARAAVILEVFGVQRYGALSGRIMMPLNLAFAGAPVFFAALLHRGGLTATLIFAAVLAALSLVAMARLAGLRREASAPAIQRQKPEEAGER